MRVAIVIRQLESLPPVVSATIAITDEYMKKHHVTNRDKHLDHLAKQHVQEVIDKFVEFRTAQWVTEFVDIDPM